MFYRNIIEKLEEWDKRSNRKPLIIRGARQVGKTTVINLFAQNFDCFLSLNLEKDSERELFEKGASPEEVLSAVYLLKGLTKHSGRVLLFIDEIQSSPKAVAMLRYFYEEIPNLRVIAAGSLLETLINIHISFPVGRVEYLALRPCSFVEFLQALGETELKTVIENGALPSLLHNRVMKLFNEYVLVGGMPEAVAVYALNKDMVAIRHIYETLLNGYRDDIEKYAKNETDKKVLRHILRYGWLYAGQRIKFERFANSNYKSREVGDAMRALEKALVVELSYPTSLTAVPIQPQLQKSPKLLWLDTGLVNYVADLQTELFGSSDISETWKGKIAEHIVGQELLATSDLVSTKRNFWTREARNSQAEVDFIYPYKGKIIPIEVKSGDNSKLKSLHLFMEESPNNIAVRFWNNSLSTDAITLPSGRQYTLYNVPFYYAGSIDAILSKTTFH
jgi:Predicted ATPase (AAA+ superfamily)